MHRAAKTAQGDSPVGSLRRRIQAMMEVARRGDAARQAPASSILDATTPDPPRSETPAVAAELERLSDRVAHLEQVMEGLQDAVHRESVRLDHELHQLRERMRPGDMARALSDDARKRGL